MQKIATESRYFNTAFEQNLELAKGFLALDYVVFQHMMFKMPRFASRIILLLRLKMFLFAFWKSFSAASAHFDFSSPRRSKIYSDSEI